MSKAKFYYQNPEAPKPNRPNHIGVNGLIICQKKLLLEKRTDSGQWGLIGGGLKINETLEQGLKREIEEETGIKACSEDISIYKIYDDPSRIASYPDGNILRIISFVYKVMLHEMPNISCSEESFEVRFFTNTEILDLDIVESHRQIVQDCLMELL